MSKKVKIDLSECGANAFGLLAVFSKTARKQGFDKQWVDSVLDEAKSGDFDHLLQTLMKHSE